MVALEVIFGCVGFFFFFLIFNSVPEKWVGKDLYYSIRFRDNEAEGV